MRPLKLELKYFGPYQHEKIDFAQFDQAPVFLVSGNTGSGKTTIFDGMCYALFNQTTNDNDRNATALRSDFAPEDHETSVTLVFEHEGVKYQISRKPAQTLVGRGGKKVNHSAKVELIYPLGSDEPKEITKINAANDFITNLLNIDRDQFKQIVLLPQGKFRRFLESSSNDKEKLLRDLFNTHLYERWTQLIKDKYKAAQMEVADLDQKLSTIKEDSEVSGENITTEDWLIKINGLIMEHHLVEKNISQEITENQELATKLNNELANGQSLKRQFEDISKFQTQLTKLGKSGDDIERIKHQVDQLEWFRDHHVLYDRWVNIKNNNKNLSREIQKATIKQQELINKGDLVSKRADEIKQQEPSIKDIEEQVSLLKDKLPLYDKRQQYQKQYDQYRKQIDEMNVQIKKDNNNRDDNNDNLNETVKALKRLSFITDREVEIEKRRSRLTTLSNQTADLQSFEEQNKRLVKKIIALQEQVDKQTNTVDNAENHYLVLKDAHARSEIARLSKELLPGTPCPVCGSTEHPHPAETTYNGKIISSEEVDRANKSYIDAKAELTKTITQLAEFKEQQKQVVQQSQTLLAKITDTKSLVGFDLVDLLKYQSHQKKVLDDDITALHKDKKLYEQLLTKQDALQNRLSEFERVINNEQHELARVKGLMIEAKTNLQSIESSLDNQYSSLEDAQKQITNWQSLINKYSIDRKTVEQELTTINEQLSVTKNDLSSKSTNLSNGQLEGKKLRRKLTTELNNYDSSLNWNFLADANKRLVTLRDLQDKVNSYQQKVMKLKVVIKNLQDKVSGKQVPDLEGISSRLGTIQSQIADDQKSVGQIQKGTEQLVKSRDSVKQLSDQNKAKMKKLASLQTLSDVVNGSTENKVGLERYVLQSYFSKVLQAANVYLNQLTNGRYTFKLSDDQGHGNGTKWSGLEVDVYDDNAGQDRSVRTLSGGESFIASLALALALGQVIQEEQGGIHIDALFIDEGFGSLDQEALSQALTALQTIEGHRMIGIISHVTELEERVPDQMQVKSVNGISHVQYRHELSIN